MAVAKVVVVVLLLLLVVAAVLVAIVAVVVAAVEAAVVGWVGDSATDLADRHLCMDNDDDDDADDESMPNRWERAGRFGCGGLPMYETKFGGTSDYENYK